MLQKLLNMRIFLQLVFLIIMSFDNIRAQDNARMPNLFGRPGEGYMIPVQVGTPPQSFNVLIDTGSTNFAVAGAPHKNIDKFFLRNRSSTYQDLGDTVYLIYTQGQWFGDLAKDIIYFPTLNSVPPVTSDVALISDAKGFYVNGSNWQGILGLAYSSISRPSPDIEPWIDSLQKKSKDITMAFSLTLCGPTRIGENQHYGSFEVLNNVQHPFKGLKTAKVVREWFYEVVLTNIYINGVPLPVDCSELNKNQAIVDSGTTNIRLPKKVFDKLTKMLIAASLNTHIVEEIVPIPSNTTKIHQLLIGESLNISEKFWTKQKMACWPKPPKWTGMPTVSIDIASNEYEYFRINLPVSSYIREEFGHQGTNTCYKFAIEPSYTGTIIGVIGLEGFQVIFNRTGKTVGFLKSNCGPDVSIEGLFSVNKTAENNLFDKCWNKSKASISLLDIAGYIVCFVLLLASCMFVYFFGQWLKNKYFKYKVTGSIALRVMQALLMTIFEIIPEFQKLMVLKSIYNSKKKYILAMFINI